MPARLAPRRQPSFEGQVGVRRVGKAKKPMLV